MTQPKRIFIISRSDDSLDPGWSTDIDAAQSRCEEGDEVWEVKIQQIYQAHNCGIKLVKIGE